MIRNTVHSRSFNQPIARLVERRRSPRQRFFDGPLAACLAVALLTAAVSPLRAGGGPENVILVVNGRSWASLTVANYYAQLRQIPPGNVLYLDWDADVLRTNVNAFREKILEPVVKLIDSRHIADHIDYIVYSADFPYSIDVHADTKDIKLPRELAPIASINGLTYLLPYTMAKNPGYMALRANQYMRTALAQHQEYPTHAFSSRYNWGPDGEIGEGPPPPQHMRYMLSTMLAFTSGRGNSVSEAIRYLNLSAAADGTSPPGTIYFVQNNDVRSRIRDRAYPAAVDALEALGVEAAIINGTIPNGRPDVQGCMIGAQKFDWGRSGSKILPGAICEHFTSAGGIMHYNTSQTPLTELLRYGAAGACGTVTEPYAIAEKFPFAFLHVHYARGCTLAESFYQSVRGPYQLLIVGDPLCRPWARIPQVALEGLPEQGAVSGTLELTPSVTRAGAADVARFDLYVDGLRIAQRQPAESFTLDTTQLSDGYHELRVVAVESQPIETQGRFIAPLDVDNHAARCEFTIDGPKTVTRGATINVSARSPGAERIVIYHNTLVLGSIEGAEGTLAIDSRRFGLGPVTLRAGALGIGDEKHKATAAPQQMLVQGSHPLPALEAPPASATAPGLRLEVEGARPQAIDGTQSAKWLEDAGVAADQPYTLSGFFDVESDDVYQFQVNHSGTVRLEVDGQLLYEGTQRGGQFVYAPISLLTGTHRMQLSGTPPGNPRLVLRFGGRGTWPVSADQFRHER